jgi:hypothetical protein
MSYHFYQKIILSRLYYVMVKVQRKSFRAFNVQCFRARAHPRALLTDRMEVDNPYKGPDVQQFLLTDNVRFAASHYLGLFLVVHFEGGERRVFHPKEGALQEHGPLCIHMCSLIVQRILQRRKLV